MDNVVDFPKMPAGEPQPGEVNLSRLVAAMTDLNRDMRDLKYAQQRNRFHINLLIKALKARGLLEGVDA